MPLCLFVKDIPREEWNSRTVADTMIPVEQGIVSRPEENMTQVLEKMAASGVRRVLVVRDGRLEGIVTANDIASWLRRRRDLGEEARRSQKLEVGNRK